MGKAAVAKAFADINAAVAVLNAEAAGCGSKPFSVADPLSGLADGCLDILAGAAGVQARVSGLVANAAGTYADTARAAAPPAVPVQAQEMAIAAEISCVMAIGDRAAGALLAQSHALTTSLPRTLAALHNGTISWQHAKVMVDETADLDPAGTAALEANFLDPDTPKPGAAAAVGEMPAYRFKVKARTWRERHHAESIEKRHAKGIADRRVEYRPDQDGMAYISGYLPADQATAVWNRISAIARGLQGPHEDRTLTELRADTFATALLSSGTTEGNDPGHVPSPRAQVLVTVPVFSLMALTEEPAMLDGFGPIPASMARNLVANGADSFYRVLVDPRDGAPLEIGRTSYRVSKALRNWLRLRDGKCPFPGCNNHSLDNEADHILAWHQGGTTGISNLGQPCPQTPQTPPHQRLETNTGHQKRTTRLDLTHRPALQKRTPRLGTTTLAKPTAGGVRGTTRLCLYRDLPSRRNFGAVPARPTRMTNPSRGKSSSTSRCLSAAGLTTGA
jgi:hypothetical protein